MTSPGTREQQLGVALGHLSMAYPLPLFLFVFYIGSTMDGWWASGGCVGLLLAWFGVYVGLDEIGSYSRKARLRVWCLSAAFHLGIVLFVWRFLGGGFSFLLAACESVVAAFSFVGFWVAFASTEKPVSEHPRGVQDISQG